MALISGTRLGVYEIVAPLGAGGMGEVYRARDTKLGRDVAIKILPEPFLSDPDRVARFQREAQLLAALNHPHIAGIYGLEESGETRFLAIELVDGESLAERLASVDATKASGLPLSEALSIARQIAEALQAAHEKGIIHRDLKPGNVMLTGDGQVKVLDFGLAKMLAEDRPESPSAAMSPTLSLHATYAGVILGTAAYMSPEQARGKVADKRTDVWAFGCVLYEMLTARRAFEGEDATDTIAAVVRGEPDWSALPSNLPADILTLLTRCLQKDRRQRFGDISVPLFLMNEPREVAAPATQPPSPPRPLWKRALPLAATAIIVAAVTGAVMWALRPAPALPIVTRFPIRLGEGQAFTNPGRQLLAISHDGSQVAYVANTRLYLRSMSNLEARPIPGTDAPAGGLTSPVFSPDGGSIAFYSNDAIKRIALTGGAAVTICSATNPLGLSWHDDKILFGQPGTGIMRVSASGGKPQVLVTLKTGELAHGPQLLPGGQAVLFTLATGTAGTAWDTADIVVQSLKSGERKTLVSGGSDGRYLPTGHVAYGFGGVVFAVRFDPRRLAVVGGPVPIIEGVQRGAAAAQFASSDNGTLIYVPGPATTSAGMLDIGLLDRQGAVQPLKLPVAQYEYPRVSPDGARLAVGTDDGKEAIIWIYELSGVSARRRLTFGGRNRVPVWSADGDRLAFQSDREGAPAVFWQRADGNGAAERLTTPEKDTTHTPQSWSPDGKRLLFTEQKSTKVSLWALSLQDKQASPYGGIDESSVTAAFSPDGRWVAYDASTSGIFVQPFPATGAKYQIAGAIHPFWSPDGKELFFVPRGRFQAVSISTQPTFRFSSPVEVLRGGFLERGPSFERTIEMLPDGKRFVGVIFAGQTDTAPPTTPTIQVVEHWFEELKAKAPVK
jgi:Tol biopolymer transport system component